MKKFFSLSLIVIALGFTACNNDKKSDEEIDSLNEASADSLLNAALGDTVVVDSIQADTIQIQ